jgi:superkiller protein 3
MSTTKVALKAAKASLDVQRYDEAVEHTNKVLAVDPQNYHAYVQAVLYCEVCYSH